MVRIVAQVQITVQIAVANETWNDHTSMEQVHREAREIAVKRITELCRGHVKLVSVPLVEAVITEKKQ